jgi:tRNA pseudouridine55 synthase
MGKAKRGATDLSGIIAIDKPAGMTSHDVVASLRRITGEGRIGHAGTLDPAATGLLLVCIGPAARLSDLIMAKEKTYSARVTFGFATDTDDEQGAVTQTAAIPPSVSDSEFAKATLDAFLGEQQQIPPHFSAIKKNGVKAYQVARKGEVPALEPRNIVVYELRLLETGKDYWDVEATVSKGTYIRSLARDIGEAVGSKAHLGSLRRTRSGNVSVEQAHSLAELETISKEGLSSLFLDPIKDLGIDEGMIPESLKGRNGEKCLGGSQNVSR